MFADACRARLEGIISKRRDEPVRAGRGRTWLKIKCVARQEFVIGGFTDPQGSRQGLGALLIGHHDDEGALVWAGKVRHPSFQGLREDKPAREVTRER